MTSRHWEIFLRRFEGTWFSHCEGSEVLIWPLNPWRWEWYFFSKRREQLALWYGVMSQKKDGFLNRTLLKISKLVEFNWFSAKNERLWYFAHGSLLLQFLPDTVAFGLYREILVSVFPPPFDKNATKTFHLLQFLLHGLRYLSENSCFCLGANSRWNCDLDCAASWVHPGLKLSGNMLSCKHTSG